jgi:diguanylate cyclase (GGDEF)-like protein/PAS domain S-box-containing protein
MKTIKPRGTCAAQPWNMAMNPEIWRYIFDAIEDSLFLHDAQFRVLLANRAYCREAGLTEAQALGKPYWEVFPPGSGPLPGCKDAVSEKGHTGSQEEVSVGEKIFLSKSYVVRDIQGKPLYALHLLSDITAQKQAATALVEGEERFRRSIGNARDAIITIDGEGGVITEWNPAAEVIFGYSKEEVIGRMLHEIITPPRFREAAIKGMAYFTTTGEGAAINKTLELVALHKNETEFPIELSLSATQIHGKWFATGIVRDISKRKQDEADIYSLGFYDSLTHLPNRRLLMDRLHQALASSARSGREGALLFIDLDNFKDINDTLGHDIGDLLLQQVGQRLESGMREGDTVARLGGDEFVVMLEDLSESALEAAAQVEAIGEKILTALNQPYQLATHGYQSTASIGVALFSNHNQSQEELLKHADIAMYQAKNSGRNVLRFFDPQMQDAIHARVDLERELRKALEQQQFQLYYQIQVDNSHRPLGAEVLIRWLHPERGLVPPIQFIPLAEESGLILPIGQWVLETACAQLKAWQQDALTRDLTLSVNVSAKQFRQVDFVAQMQSLEQRHAINPTLLKLELTESMLLENIEGTITTMIALKEIGIRFSLDDFGTGYSSLQHLKRLPIYQLKIDQSFVRDIANDKAIVRTIIAMANSLGLDVIAEGVETEEQRQLLLNKGCTHYQGYLFSKPVPIEQFEALLKHG